jgi:ribosomal protein L21E
MAEKLTPEDYDINDPVQIIKHESYKGANGKVVGKTTSYIIVEIDKDNSPEPKNPSGYYLENEKPNLLIDPNHINKLENQELI